MTGTQSTAPPVRRYDMSLSCLWVTHNSYMSFVLCTVISLEIVMQRCSTYGVLLFSEIVILN